MRSRWRQIDDGEELQKSQWKLKRVRVETHQSLRIIDISISTSKWWISTPLRMIIFTLWRSGMKLTGEQVQALKSLMVIDLHSPFKHNHWSYKEIWSSNIILSFDLGRGHMSADLTVQRYSTLAEFGREGVYVQEVMEIWSESRVLDLGNTCETNDVFNDFVLRRK